MIQYAIIKLLPPLLPSSAPRLVGGLRVCGLLAVVMRDRLKADGHVNRVRADAWACARVPCSSRSGRVAACWPAAARVSVRDALGDADDDVGELEDRKLSEQNLEKGSNAANHDANNRRLHVGADVLHKRADAEQDDMHDQQDSVEARRLEDDTDKVADGVTPLSEVLDPSPDVPNTVRNEHFEAGQ